jgi:hypothetical protein
MNPVDNEEFVIISSLLNRPLGPMILSGKLSEYSIDTNNAHPNNSSAILEDAHPTVGSGYSSIYSIPLARAVSDSYAEQHINGRENSFYVGRKRALSLDFQPSSKTRRPRSSSLGHLGAANSQFILRHLISALNHDFPDYDFSNSSMDQFTAITVKQAVSLVSTHLAYLCLTESLALDRVWSAIDECTNLKACDVFLFRRDDNEESFSSIWCFHIFFVNTHIKKMCYFECSATM